MGAELWQLPLKVNFGRFLGTYKYLGSHDQKKDAKSAEEKNLARLLS